MKRLIGLMVLVASMGYGATVGLSWTDDKNPTGTTWNVYRGVGLCGAVTQQFTKVASGLNVKTFTDAGVVSGTYCFYVTAQIGTDESVPSNKVAVTLQPAAPTGLTAVVNP